MGRGVQDEGRRRFRSRSARRFPCGTPGCCRVTLETRQTELWRYSAIMDRRAAGKRLCRPLKQVHQTWALVAGNTCTLWGPHYRSSYWRHSRL